MDNLEDYLMFRLDLQVLQTAKSIANQLEILLGCHGGVRDEVEIRQKNT